MNQEYLDIFGVLENVVVNNSINSLFLEDLILTLEKSELFLDFYMLSESNLFLLSNDFQNSFTYELSGAGITFNGKTPTSVPEPQLLIGIIISLVLVTFLKQG